MPKIVINRCYGGFSLSKKAVKMLAEMSGRKCFFFKHEPGNIYKFVPDSELDSSMFWSAFDVPDPNEVVCQKKPWAEMSGKEKSDYNANYEKHHISNRPENRSDKNLIKVVETLGSEAASGSCAELSIVQIPNGVEYSIEEYDGIEHVAEKHRTWA